MLLGSSNDFEQRNAFNKWMKEFWQNQAKKELEKRNICVK